MTLERHPGEWTHAPEPGAAYTYLHDPTLPGGVARTVAVDSSIVNLDLDADGRGIEILAAWPQASAVPEGDVRDLPDLRSYHVTILFIWDFYDGPLSGALKWHGRHYWFSAVLGKPGHRSTRRGSRCTT